MPSLNPRTPSPSPRISSGILRPPNRISTTTRIISQCIGNSMLPPTPYPPHANIPRCSPRSAVNSKNLKYNTLIPGPPRDSLPVQVFQQGNGVLAGNPRQFLENRHRDALALGLLERRKPLSELRQRVAMKDQLRCDPHQVFLAQQDLQELLRALGFHR